MQLLRFFGRAIQFALDCTIVLLAIAFILLSAVVMAVVKMCEALVLWLFNQGDAKGRARASWQQGI